MDNDEAFLHALADNLADAMHPARLKTNRYRNGVLPCDLVQKIGDWR